MIAIILAVSLHRTEIAKYMIESIKGHDNDVSNGKFMRLQSIKRVASATFGDRKWKYH